MADFRYPLTSDIAVVEKGKILAHKIVLAFCDNSTFNTIFTHKCDYSKKNERTIQNQPARNLFQACVNKNGK